MYVRSMSNWTEWVQWTRGVARHAANMVLVFGYETKHEAIAEGQAMVFRSNREFIQIFA